MTFRIVEPSIDEIVAFTLCIPEFTRPPQREEYERRLSAKHLRMAAIYDGIMVGCKVGYEIDKDTFYSWIGAVLKDFRRTKIATHLADAQEIWARTEGYKRITLKTNDCFPYMISMSARRKYAVAKTEYKDDKLWYLMEKQL
jgi:GNAT superfamily N-acetyltransferase